jgi:RNA polymerase sigma-70 factor (ECF subfamily)
VVQLSFLEERTQSQIAEHLSLPLGTVKSRIRLALLKLRVQLEHLE